MASDPHHLIKKIMKDIILEYNPKKSAYPLLEKEKDIKINDPDSKEVIEYKPDYTLKRNISKHSYYYIVFEIIDEQSDVKTMADIARILAKNEVRKAIFISCSKPKKKETDRLISVLVGSYKTVFRKKNKKEILDIVSKMWHFSKDKFEEKYVNKDIIVSEIKSLLPKKPNN